MAQERTIERIKKEISYLENIINKEEDRQKVLNYQSQLKKIKKELTIIIEKENREQPGISARNLIDDFNKRPKKEKLETGIISLDNQLEGGVEHGSFVTLGGQSHLGKSYITFEILTHIARNSKTVFFNFEMAIGKVVRKLQKFCKNDNQLDNLIIDDTSREIDDLIMEITLYADKGVQLFVIDSMMKIESKIKEQHIHFSNISNSLAKLAQQKNIVIILINQISEEDLKSGRLSFKGSGNIMYDSDISIFLTRDKKGKKYMSIAKNRQTEELFKMDLKLDDDGKTYCENIQPLY